MAENERQQPPRHAPQHENLADLSDAALQARIDALASLDKAKQGGRNASVNPDDVVNLEQLMRDYESRYGDRLALDDDFDTPKTKEKPKLGYKTEKPQPKSDAASLVDEMRLAGDEIRKMGRDIGISMGKVGAEFGRAAGEVGGKAGKIPGEFGKKFGKDLGEQIEEFFKNPYEPGYESVQYNVTAHEKNIASLAHASSLFTLMAGVFTAGIAVPFLVFVPLWIYLSYRGKSEFVARHAMQAFVMQLVGTFGYVAVVGLSALVGVVLTVLLAITIVGILAIPFLWLTLILFWIATLALPLGMAGFGLVGAIRAAQGRSYKYPYIGKWVDRDLRKEGRVRV
jgi:uncharacterized Tic20 family protein